MLGLNAHVLAEFSFICCIAGRRVSLTCCDDLNLQLVENCTMHFEAKKASQGPEFRKRRSEIASPTKEVTEVDRTSAKTE